MQDTVRSLERLRSSRRHELVFEVEADGFLRKMVRSLVGALIALGRGTVTVGELRRALEAANGRLARPPPPVA